MNKTEFLRVARIRGTSILKLVYLGSLIGSTLIALCFGVAALFGAETITWNGKHITGVAGLIVSPFLGVFMGLLSGTFSAITIYLGLRFYSLFDDIEIRYIPANDDVAVDDISDN